MPIIEKNKTGGQNNVTAIETAHNTPPVPRRTGAYFMKGARDAELRARDLRLDGDVPARADAGAGAEPGAGGERREGERSREQGEKSETHRDDRSTHGAVSDTVWARFRARVTARCPAPAWVIY